MADKADMNPENVHVQKFMYLGESERTRWKGNGDKLVKG